MPHSTMASAPGAGTVWSPLPPEAAVHRHLAVRPATAADLRADAFAANDGANLDAGGPLPAPAGVHARQSLRRRYVFAQPLEVRSPQGGHLRVSYRLATARRALGLFRGSGATASDGIAVRVLFFPQALQADAPDAAAAVREVVLFENRAATIAAAADGSGGVDRSAGGGVGGSAGGSGSGGSGGRGRANADACTVECELLCAGVVHLECAHLATRTSADVVDLQCVLTATGADARSANATSASDGDGNVMGSARPGRPPPQQQRLLRLRQRVMPGQLTYLPKQKDGLTLGMRLIRQVAGKFSLPDGKAAAASLSPGARRLVRQAYEGLPQGPGGVVDYHCHIIGCGHGGSGCYVTSGMTDPRNALGYVKFQAFMSAVGVFTPAGADGKVVRRLLRLLRGFHSTPGGTGKDGDDADRSGGGGDGGGRGGDGGPGGGEAVTGTAGAPGQAAGRAQPHARAHLLAFDMVYNEAGDCLPEESTMHVPNEYVWKLHLRHPDCITPCVSVHPYRRDAVEELTRWADRGVRFVKWLPNSQRIDPLSPLCYPFYDCMARRGMVLLSHVGEEHSVAPPEPVQEYGNPLRLRAALDRGVQVIMAHCATEGHAADLDAAAVTRSGHGAGGGGGAAASKAEAAQADATTATTATTTATTATDAAATGSAATATHAGATTATPPPTTTTTTDGTTTGTATAPILTTAAARRLPQVACFALWQRMMDDPRYTRQLTADISAVTAFKRVRYLATILDRVDLHPRLVYGSDYPVPCLNFVVQTSLLVRKQLITSEQRTFLNEIYAFNPLLFDFVCKRTLRSPGSGARLSDCIFGRHPSHPDGLAPPSRLRGAVGPGTATATGADYAEATSADGELPAGAGVHTASL